MRFHSKHYDLSDYRYYSIGCGAFKGMQHCSCVRLPEGKLHNELEADLNCTNCLGYGIPPIPLSEVNK